MSVLRKRKNEAEIGQPVEMSRSRKHAKITHITKSKSPKHTAMKTARQVPHEAAVSVEEPVATNRQKRKRGADENTDHIGHQSNTGNAMSTAPSWEPTVTPQHKRFRDALPPSPMETPSRKTARLFDRLDLHQATSTNTYDTPPATPESSQNKSSSLLPPALIDLVEMYSAFLSALNEQVALSSSSFRINVRDILGVTTSIWTRRDVTTDDLRKLLELADVNQLGWIIEDYGRAGLCMIRIAGQEINILDTLKLARAFESAVTEQWQQWQSDHAQQDTVDAFTEQLALAPIKKSDSVDKAASLSSRGKDRLASLKRSQAEAQTVDLDKKTIPQPKSASAGSRGTSLLDRILAKQAVTASMPVGPSREQLERKSILQRVEEVARVLEMLSAGKARASFSMQTVVQQLQQSLRTPISRADVERCVMMMSLEVMPGYVTIVRSGTVTGVVLTRAGKLDIADLKKRIADVDI